MFSASASLAWTGNVYCTYQVEGRSSRLGRIALPQAQSIKLLADATSDAIIVYRNQSINVPMQHPVSEHGVVCFYRATVAWLAVESFVALLQVIS
jgi:hypothetical protein